MRLVGVGGGEGEQESRRPLGGRTQEREGPPEGGNGSRVLLILRLGRAQQRPGLGRLVVLLAGGLKQQDGAGDVTSRKEGTVIETYLTTTTM